MMVSNVAITLTAVALFISFVTEDSVFKKFLYSAIAIVSMISFRYAERPIWLKWMAVGVLAILVTHLVLKFIHIDQAASQQSHEESD